jgi:hypothetical protein
MPEICRFFGIVIRMHFDDHDPPHFHVEYGGENGVVSIEDLTMISGAIPPRALGLTVEWASLHRDELRQLWRRARNLEPLRRIDPLA